MRPCHALFVLAALAPAVARADGPPASLTETVKAAVAGGKVEDVGNLYRVSSFRDVAPDGSLLVGLEVGLARWFDSEIPFAVRPIFRRGSREWTGGTAGSFSSRQVVRVMQEAARPGYAVGGMWVRTGAGMDRLCLVYFKVTDAGLDPSDHYTGPWVGTSDGGGDRYIDGKGRPIVGLTADAGRDQARSLGFVIAQLPAVPRKPDPKAEPPAPKATKAEPKGEAKAEPNAGPKVEPRADPKAAPAVPAAGPKKSKLEEEGPPPEEEEDNTLLLLLLLACVGIGLPVGLFALATMGKPDRRRRRDLDEDDDRPRRRPQNLDEEGDRPRRRRRDPDEDDDRPRRPRPAGPERERPAVVPAPAKARRPELARRLAPYVPAPVAPAAAAALEGARGEAPPYFLVRATYRSRHSRMTRIYVRPNEVLLIDCGAGADRNDAAGLAAAVLSGGGLVGGFIGGAVSSIVADAGKAKGEAIQQQLNRLGLAELLELAEARGNLRAAVTDLVGVTIDPPTQTSSLWTRKEPSRAVGTFRFRSLGKGEYSFEFLNGAELRGAIELLRRVLGDALHIGREWDEATEVYLRGL